MTRRPEQAIGAHHAPVHRSASVMISRSWAYPRGRLNVSGRTDRWFGGVVVTNGRGQSAHRHLRRVLGCGDAEGPHPGTNARRAYVGEYGFQAQLGFSSAQVKDPRETRGGERSGRDPGAPSRTADRSTLHNPADQARYATSGVIAALHRGAAARSETRDPFRRRCTAAKSGAISTGFPTT